ncbi:MAG: DNA oxidative demethylase AlkB [Pseudomonadota bacterium]
MHDDPVTADLFEEHTPQPSQLLIAAGAMLLRGFAQGSEAALLKAFDDVTAQAPLRHLVTPGGYTMSVGMTNCGPLGWVSDRRGYRYQSTDPLSGQPWPVMPDMWRDLAARAASAAGYPGFSPDACLVNSYQPGSKLSLHQDKDEKDMGAPIVSVSLGLPAVFLFGSDRRADKPQRLRLVSGDVVVWGGASRLAFHGIGQLADGDHALTGRRRTNLTFRKAV